VKIRTLLELSDAVDEETAWRRQELSLSLSSAKLARGLSQAVALRAGVALLYAHWEGWIKGVSTLYVRYVRAQRLAFSEMSPGFLGNALKTRIELLDESNRASMHTEFAEFIAESMGDRARLSEHLVRTESNLSSAVLSEILCRLDIADDPFETMKHQIDTLLLHRRNRIAHGVYLDLDIDAYVELHHAVLGMLDRFTNDVLNGAITGSYKTLSSRAN